MKRTVFRICFAGFILIRLLVPASLYGEENAAEANAENNRETLMQRIDFGNAYITGQTIKSGAVYLLQRKKSEIRSMLDYRRDYRKEILEEYRTVGDRPDLGFESVNPD